MVHCNVCRPFHTYNQQQKAQGRDALSFSSISTNNDLSKCRLPSRCAANDFCRFSAVALHTESYIAQNQYHLQKSYYYNFLTCFTRVDRKIANQRRHLFVFYADKEIELSDSFAWHSFSCLCVIQFNDALWNPRHAAATKKKRRTRKRTIMLLSRSFLLALWDKIWFLDCREA